MSKFFYFFVIISLLFSACAKEAKEIKVPKQESKQVLSAFFSDEMDTLWLFIARSEWAIGSQESKGVVDADVGLFEEGVKVLGFESAGNGFYKAVRGSFSFVVGKEYEIKSKAPGLEEISAKSILLSEIRPDTIMYSANSMVDEQAIKLSITFKDSIGPDFYGFFVPRFYVGDSLLSEIFWDVKTPSQALFDNTTISDIDFDGNVGVLTFDCRSNDVKLAHFPVGGNKISITIHHISELWYHYNHEIFFNEPDPEEFLFSVYAPEDVPGNVKGGYGFFGLANAGTIEIIF